MMMVWFFWKAILAFMAGTIISGIFLVFVGLAWAAAWRRHSIRVAFLEFLGS